VTVETHNDALPDVPKSALYRLLELPGLALLGGFAWLVSRSGLDRVFFEVDDFPWVRDVEAGYPAIRAELDRLLAERSALVPDVVAVFPEQRRLTEEARWKSFFFRLYDHVIEENAAQCPETANALAKIPNVRTAFFSIFEPGAALKEHRGPYKGVLRYHLGLITPAQPSRCGIAFGGETRFWQEGKSLIFDDTHPHRAWNDSDEVRVVLFVDFDRPMPWPLRGLHRIMFGLLRRSPFITRVIRNIRNESKARTR